MDSKPINLWSFVMTHFMGKNRYNNNNNNNNNE